MNPVKLFVNPALVKSSQEVNNPLLKVPENAVPGRKNALRWTERLRVEEATVETITDEDGKPNGRHALRLRFKVSASSLDKTNLGRTTRASYLINLGAAEGTGDHMMTNISLGRVQALLRALGYSVSDQGFDLEEFFNPASPLINGEVNAVIVDHPDRNDPSTRRQDIGNFTMVED